MQTPRLIQEIHNAGIKIYPVDKSGNSIIAGIDKMLSLTISLLQSGRIISVQSSESTYGTTDKDGNYINQPIDKYNHGIDAVRYYVLGQLLGKILNQRAIWQQLSPDKSI